MASAMFQMNLNSGGTPVQSGEGRRPRRPRPTGCAFAGPTRPARPRTLPANVLEPEETLYREALGP